MDLTAAKQGEEQMGDRLRIPRNSHNDYTREAASIRRNFVKIQTGVDLPHVGQYSFDPDVIVSGEWVSSHDRYGLNRP